MTFMYTALVVKLQQQVWRKKGGGKRGKGQNTRGEGYSNEEEKQEVKTLKRRHCETVLTK